ncbi:MAG: NapC/NirT family cytochrome c [Rudaea sp.]
MDEKNRSAGSAGQPRRGIWHWLWQPSGRWFLLGLPVGAILTFLLGIGFTVGVLRPQLRFTESQNFCTSCHEMQVPYEQLKHSFHYSNEFGIRVTCADCHLPPTLGASLLAHFNARVDVWGHLTGVIDTPAKFEADKLRMAQVVWKELKESNSASCRKCHSFAAMALDKQSHSAAKHHSPEYIAKTGKTCIDCHKGVAHELPQRL